METRTYFGDIRHYLLRELRKARKSICAVVEWFTDQEVLDILSAKAVEGVTVRLIMPGSRINNDASDLNFSDFTRKGGTVLFIGQDMNRHAVLHNKFCVIDSHTVITGIYNWIKRTQGNFENITITTEGIVLAAQFIDEFRVIEKSADTGASGAADYPRIKKRADTVRSLILLEDEDDIAFQTAKLKKLIRGHETDTGLNLVRQAVRFIENREYGAAMMSIEEFNAAFQQMAVYDNPIIVAIKLEIRSLETRLGALQEERADIDKMMRAFEIRHARELGPVIIRILELRRALLRKEAELDSSRQTEYERAEKDYRDYTEDYNEMSSEQIAELSEEQQKEIKAKYRKASKLCHPDIVAEEMEDMAREIFQELSDAYAENNLARVSEILANIEQGMWFAPKSEKLTEKARLELLAIELRRKNGKLLAAISRIKLSDTYKKIHDIEDMDAYFFDMKEELMADVRNLEEAFGK